MKRQYLLKHPLPDSPGIYIFRNKLKRPLYIGRATSLKERVKSYFAPDLIVTRGPRVVDMVTKAHSLTWQKASNVLEAIFLESALIKKYQPFYNVDERDDKSSQYVVITNEEWPRVFLERARDFDQAKESGQLKYPLRNYFGPFVDIGLIKDALRILRRLFPFRDKKAIDPRHEEFYRSLGRSPEKILAEDKMKYRKTISYLTLFFKGESARLKKIVEKDMRKNAKATKFEEAAIQRKLLYALNHINDISLIKRTNGNGIKQCRIEAYDVAHLSGTNVVGSMVVCQNGNMTPSEYRKFKIHVDKNDDIAGLVEILSRRLNHSEWTYPDIIAVDGGDIHKKAAESVLRARRINIPVIAVTKDERHKAVSLLGNSDLIQAYRDDIINANSEAHRFAITYHRKRRGMLK